MNFKINIMTEIKLKSVKELDKLDLSNILRDVLTYSFLDQWHRKF